MNSVMKHQFSRVPQAQIERSSFDRSHGLKSTFNAGLLIPIFVDEALPGDTFNLRMNAFARLATPLKPIMDNMFMDSFFFAVPYRLVWNNWEKFNGAQDNPDDSTDFLVPQMTTTAGGPEVGTLSDYFGLPTDIASAYSFNSLWHRCYNLIWNTWFRDQNLQDSVVVDKDDGPDTYGDYVLLRRGKRHDYFTSALPWPQKGDEVTIPLGTTAPVISNTNTPTFNLSGAGDVNEQLRGWNALDTLGTPVARGMLGVSTTWTVPGNFVIFGNESGLVADLSSATAQTINALREAFQLQRLYERDARGGTRYIEILKAHFGVTSPDARLQRPEYLGGGSTPVNIHPVAATSDMGSTPSVGSNYVVGALGGFGTVGIQGHGFTKSFTEHCLIIGMVSVRADLTYQQGLDRMFSRQTRFDFFWPAFAHLGEQSVLNKEIYVQGTAADNDVFGYQERFAEYRYKPSRITGQLRSTYATSLDIWHLSQEFGSLPVLGPTFIQDNPPIDRVIAVPDEPHFIFDAYFDYKCARPMPVYGVPGMIDHF